MVLFKAQVVAAANRHLWRFQPSKLGVTHGVFFFATGETFTGFFFMGIFRVGKAEAVNEVFQVTLFWDISGQITIIPKPEFSGDFGGDSLTY